MLEAAYADLVSHQPEAQHPKSSAIHKLPADYPIYLGKPADIRSLRGFALDPQRTYARLTGLLNECMPGH
jgi:hypothetical protein